MSKQSVGILLFDNVEVLDFAGPFEVFSVASELHNYELFDVFTFAKTKEPVIAVNGLSVNPKYTLTDLPAIDILIIPGGDGTKKLIKDQELIRQINKIIDQASLTMTVCSGARVPALLGRLNGKPFCTHHEVFEAVNDLAPTAIPKPDLRYVQSDESLYTSGGISAGIDLSFHLLHKLHGREVVDHTAKYMEYRLEEKYTSQ
ncbi:MAG: DJ-1/PfpI family protein [Cyclobacteriaceae bacterium]